MNNPLVSIIIPTFNRAHLISETLDSVLAQTYQNWECIIVDDGSTDNTNEMVGAYTTKDSRFQFYYRPVGRPKGANACRNYGFETSKGGCIMFLDSDDTLEIFCVLDRVMILDENPEINLLIRDTALFDNNQKLNFTINKDPTEVSNIEYLQMFLRYEIPWTIMGAFYKRNILEIYKFDEKLKRFQDVSFSIKILSLYDNLNIYRDFKIDNYYRVDNEKIYRDNFVGIVLNSLLFFYEIHSDLLKNEKFKFDFRRFNEKIIHEFLFPNFKNNKLESNRIFLWSIKSRIYDLETKFLFFLTMFFMNLGIFEWKNIGMHRLYKMLNKKIRE